MRKGEGQHLKTLLWEGADNNAGDELHESFRGCNLLPYALCHQVEDVSHPLG